jgi:hypothetical protein
MVTIKTTRAATTRPTSRVANAATRRISPRLILKRDSIARGRLASELHYMGHTLSDNHHGLIVNARVTRADGHAEREAAKVMLNDARQAIDDDRVEITVGADKGYDAQEFIEAC